MCPPTLAVYLCSLCPLADWVDSEYQPPSSYSSVFVSGSITPIFTLSSVSGENLDLLKVFLNILPPLTNSKEQEELMQQLTEFQVHKGSLARFITALVVPCDKHLGTLDTTGRDTVNS